MMPSLSVVHVFPFMRRKEAPALSSPTKPMEPFNSPSTNHLKPTGTSTTFRLIFAATRSIIWLLTSVFPTIVFAFHCIGRGRIHPYLSIPVNRHKSKCGIHIFFGNSEIKFIMFCNRLPVMYACTCLLYTSDAADDLLCVDLGGR